MKFLLIFYARFTISFSPSLRTIFSAVKNVQQSMHYPIAAQSSSSFLLLEAVSESQSLSLS